MKLITFEVTTPVGPFTRLGAVIESGGEIAYADLNFALTASLAKEGSPRPQEMAGAIIPAEMLAFAAAGESSLEAAAESLEFLRIFQELDHLVKGFLRFITPRNIGKGNL